MRTTHHSLQVADQLARFIDDEVLPGTGVDAAAFWAGFDAIVADLAPKNIALLAERDRLQGELDAWHTANPGPVRKMKRYRAFLEKIGYLVPAPDKVRATTKNVDAELALQAGPQLVVPILNARYALNAANARWGSLYDALYGTDAIPETDGATRAGGYNPVRGAKVIEYARHVLDRTAPLAKGSHLRLHRPTRCRAARWLVTLKDGQHGGPEDRPSAVRQATRGMRPRRARCCWCTTACTWRSASTAAPPIGSSDPAGVSDLVLEVGAVHHPRPGGLGGRRGRRRQGAGLPQLAGHPQGRR
jgi:malate synthase